MMKLDLVKWRCNYWLHSDILHLTKYYSTNWLPQCLDYRRCYLIYFLFNHVIYFLWRYKAVFTSLITDLLIGIFSIITLKKVVDTNRYETIIQTEITKFCYKSLLNVAFLWSRAWLTKKNNRNIFHY